MSSAIIGDEQPGQVDAGTTITEELEQVVIRFAGDSGDGMQLTGTRFTAEAGFLETI